MTRAAPAGPDVERYQRAVAALAERGRFGTRLGLGRTRALLRQLGEPQSCVRGVLVAGTNGKGSVQALIAAMIGAAGLRTGQTPKPHLLSYRERIMVDGRPIGGADFADLLERVTEAAGRLPARLGPATEFELVTAAAFDWFARRDVQVAVVEVGLGGRLDATNAWDGGVAVITTVALDHTELLGPTLTHIAREKAAIIKRGDIAVSGVIGEGRLPIVRRARRLGVPLREVEPLAIEDMGRTGMAMHHPSLGRLRVGLLGRHQAGNVAVAIAAVTALGEAGIASVPAAMMCRGLASARWPGRLELLTIDAHGHARPATAEPTIGQTDILLDGAHNPEGAQALARALGESRPMLSGGGRPVFLTGVLADKDVAGMVGAMMGAVMASDALVLTTTVPGTSRALDARELAARWSDGLADARQRSATRASRTPVAIPDVDDALGRAIAEARSGDGPVVVFGSLGLVGHVRGRLMADIADG